MFIDDLKKNFVKDEPIFIEDILRIYKEYSRATIFRNISKAKQNGEIKQFSKGVYYFPSEAILKKPSVLSNYSVIERKYLKDSKNNIYGIFSGLKLLNDFNMTRQVPNTLEIVTNNESSRKREINIDGTTYILRKSRTEINNDNYKAYTILQLLNDLDIDDLIEDNERKSLIKYINNAKITKSDLLNMSTYFASRVGRKLRESGILNEIRWKKRRL